MEHTQLQKNEKSAADSREFKIDFESRFNKYWKVSQFYGHPSAKKWVQTIRELALFVGMCAEDFNRKVEPILLMVCSSNPFCETIKRLEHVVKLTMLTFVLDDYSDSGDPLEVQTLWNQMSLGCDKVMSKETSILMADWNVCAMFAFAINEAMAEEITDQMARNRFFNLNKTGYSNQIIENSMIQKGLETFSFDEIKKVRIESSGIKQFIQWAQYSNNIFLTDQEWMSPMFQHFFELISEIVVRHNDIISFEKELRYYHGNLKVMPNLISQLIVRDSLTIESGLSKSIEEVIQLESDCDEAFNYIINDQTFSQNVKRFVDLMLYVAGGVYGTSIRIKRYN